MPFRSGGEREESGEKNMPRRTVAQALMAKNKGASLVGASESSAPPPKKKQRVTLTLKIPLLLGLIRIWGLQII